ncbi:MAG TPA: S8 family serine peptidase [Ignavibacteria bacterium]|nr:S8 family serine peptidase [Ignavibacteria bacterium]
MKKILLIVFIFLVAGNVFPQYLKITDRLQNKIQTLNPLEYTRVLIILKDQVDIETLDIELYRINATLEYRSQTVINTLQQKARQTQGKVLDILSKEKENGKVKEYIDFWVSNVVYAEVTAEIVNELSRLDEIGLIDLDEKIYYDKPVYDEYLPANNSTESAETGLKVIKADMLWRLGITGSGRTVMHIDTGVDGLHPALAPRWWGNNGRPWFHAWFDPVSPFTTSPTDCGSHGTHTMGIMCGRNTASGDTVGVAPDAYWMSAGITDCPGASYPSMNIAAYQWAMDPDSNSATMDMPDVISCSWQDPNVPGVGQCTSIYVSTLNAVEAAGIAVVFSAGNSGPGASTVTPPKNINTDSVNVFCVGAVDGNTAGTPIASFSSRGPSICGGSGTLLIKPEVSAPGVNVRSLVPGNSYGLNSGTSMASPHVAGCIALLKQAAPNLTGKQLKAILFTTCTDLGTPGEDNDYGKGLVNVYEAFMRLGLFPLNNFNLQTPPAGTRLVTFPNSNVPVTITWDTSATGAQYKWIFGSPTTSPRKLTIPSNTNTLTTTLGQLDALLAGIGVAQGDSLAGQWDVWAFRLSPVDSMKAGNGPRALTLKRGVPSLSAFNLSSPPSGTTILTTPTDLTLINPNWTRSGQGVKYKWIFASPTFTQPNIKAIYQSDNSGFDTTVSIRASKLDSLAAGLGIGINDSISGQWRVYAYSAADSLASAQTYNLKIRRLPVTTVTIGNGTADESYPLNRFYNYYRWQGIYTGSEIGTSGTIRKIKFYQNNSVGGVSNDNMRIFMKITTDSLLPTGGWDSTGMTQVFSGTTTSLAAPGWQEIQLTTPIYINSNQNLMISICRDYLVYVNTYPRYAYSVLTSYKARRGQSDTQYPTSLTQSFNRPNVQFEIGLVTGISNNFTESIPDTYSLSQNYPNPFNPTTNLEFGISKLGFVSLKVYDVLGKEVMTLVNEIKPAGRYKIDFNGSNLSSGMYFYKLEAGNFTETKRMLLIK